MRFQCAPLSPRVEATGDVGRRVDVCLVLRNPTLAVRASERRLRTSRAEVSAGVTRLTGVRRVHLLNRDTSVTRFVLDASGETRERPIVETAVHPFAVVEMFADVRQVFENYHGFLELLGVLDGLSRRFLHDVRQRVLVVVESLVNTPVSVTFLETAKRREHLLAEVSRSPAIDQHRLNWSIVLTGTARQEFGFTDIETDRRRVVRFLGFRDFVLNGDMQDPVGAVFLQSELADRHVAVKQVCPERFLSGVDTERNPEGVATSGLRNAPTKFVRSIAGVVKFPSTVRKSNGMVVFEFRSVVRPAELRDVVLERVLGVGREIVAGNDIVDRRLCIRATLERLDESAAIHRHGTLKPVLFVRRWGRKRGFERFRAGGFGGHPALYRTTRSYIRIWNMFPMYAQKHPHQNRRRPVRRTERLQRPKRIYMERTLARRLPRPPHRRYNRVGQQPGETSATAQLTERDSSPP